MTRYADLHVHTFYSDSTFSPEEVMACAKDKGLDAIAICDHDSIDGIEPCQKIGRELGIEIIAGIELTVEKTDTEAHILGYVIDWKVDWFQNRLKELQAARVDRIYKMVERLKGFHIQMEPNDVFELAGKGSVGRLHLAQAMLRTGRIKNLKEAFDRYIGFGKPCYVPNMYFSSKEAIDIIRNVGGVPVLAHPDVMGNDAYIQEFIEYGLRGIEVYHTDHKPHVARHYEEIAKRFDLIVTGGSDCHGLGKGRVLMGGVRVPYELVEKLKNEARKIANDHR
ncbi:MAG: PHP domain-containing protein [Candidatus Omnitrophica bacterium]|nr:PHP domain-containing protein [Candidatus Omnitrophota bacterium]